MFKNLTTLAKSGHTNPTKNGGNNVHSKPETKAVATSDAQGTSATIARPPPSFLQFGQPMATAATSIHLPHHNNNGSTVHTAGAPTGISTTKIFRSFSTAKFGDQAFRPIVTTSTKSAPGTTNITNTITTNGSHRGPIASESATIAHPIPTLTSSVTASPATSASVPEPSKAAVISKGNTTKPSTTTTTSAPMSANLAMDYQDLLLGSDDFDLEALMDDLGDEGANAAAGPIPIPLSFNKTGDTAATADTVGTTADTRLAPTTKRKLMDEQNDSGNAVDDHNDNLLPSNIPDLSERCRYKAVAASSSLASVKAAATVAATAREGGVVPQQRRAPSFEQRHVQVKQEVTTDDRTAIASRQEKEAVITAASSTFVTRVRPPLSAASSINPPTGSVGSTRSATMMNTTTPGFASASVTSRRPILEDTIAPAIRAGSGEVTMRDITNQGAVARRNHPQKHQQQVETEQDGEQQQKQNESPLSRSSSSNSIRSGNKRRLPGPAGNLPKLTLEEKEKLFRSRGVPLSKRELAAGVTGVQNTTTGDGPKDSIRRKMAMGIQHGPVDSDFAGGAWELLLETYGLPDYKPSTYQQHKGSSPILAISLCDIPTNEALYQGKIDALVVLIKEINLTELDASVVVMDPSGEMRGNIHRKVLEHYKNNEIRVGTALALQHISVFSPTPTSHYLNITLANIAGVFLPSPTVISLSQCSSSAASTGIVSPRTQQPLSQSSPSSTRGTEPGAKRRRRSHVGPSPSSSSESQDLPSSQTRLQQIQEEEIQSSMEFAPKSPTPRHPPLRYRRRAAPTPRQPSPDWDDVVVEDSQERVGGKASDATHANATNVEDGEKAKEQESKAGVDFSPVVTEGFLTRYNSQEKAPGEIEEEEDDDEPLVRHRHSDTHHRQSPPACNKEKQMAIAVKHEPLVEEETGSIREIQFQSLPQAPGRSSNDGSSGDKDATMTLDDLSGTFPQMGPTPMGILGGATPKEQQHRASIPPPSIPDRSGSRGSGSGRAMLASFAAPKNLQRRSVINSPPGERKHTYSSTPPRPSSLVAATVASAGASSTGTAAAPSTLVRNPSSNDDWLIGVDEAALDVTDLEEEEEEAVPSEEMPKMSAAAAPLATSFASTQAVDGVVADDDDDFDALLQGIDDSELFDDSL